MTWLIEADALIEIFDKDKYDYVRNEYQSGYNDGLLHAEVVADNLPTVDAVSVVHGKWVKSGRWGRVYRCDQCGNYLDFDGVNVGRGDANYCPNCGADMRGE